MKKSTKKLTVASLLCALCTVLLLIGSFLEVLDLSVAALSSFIVIFAVIEMGGAYPSLIWLVSSALALLLLPNKLPAVYFSLFFGWYPILKNILERLPSIVSWALKIITFLISQAVIIYISIYVLATDDFTLSIAPALFVSGVAVFVIFDFALTRIITAYLRVWRQKLKFKI